MTEEQGQDYVNVIRMWLHFLLVI